MAGADLIQEYLNKRFQRRKESFWDPKPGIYHASDSGKCLRQIYYKHQHGPRPDPSSYPNFWRGNIIEDLMEKALKNEYGHQAIVNSMRISLNPNGLKIVGETDLVLFDVNGEITKLFEIKSTNPKGFKYRKKSPSDHHIYQVHPYMKALDLRECEMIYVCIKKNTIAEKHHQVTFDDVTYGKIVDRLSKLNDHIESKNPPPAEPFADWNCQYCSYKEECEAGKDD